MNWNDIAPEGTAAWCNAWRSRYRSMPFSQHQSDTDAIMLGHVDYEGEIDSKNLIACLSPLRVGEWRIIEFGGWRGAMANSVLSRFPTTIWGWTNYEICPSSLRDIHCQDERYQCLVTNKFWWDTSRPTDGNIFCSSHAIEHLTSEHLERLFRWLPDAIEWMYLCAPIQESTTEEKWQDYGGTHILEIGWEQVLALLPDFEVLESGEQFRWLRRKHA